MGNMNEWNIEDGELIKNWGEIHQTEYIDSIVVSRDNKYLFTSDHYGNLKQWSIEKKEIIYNFGKVHSGEIHSISL